MKSFDYIPFILNDIYIIPEHPDEKPAQQPVQEEKNTVEVSEISEVSEVSDTNQEKVEGLGHYEKRILVILDNPLSDEDSVFLLKIFKALNILLKDIKVTSQPISVKTLVNYQINQPQAMIHFTSSLDLPKYDFIRKDEIDILYCDELSKIQSNVSLKKELWGVLKTSNLTKM